MAIQDSDLLLINRAGASYKVAASDLVDKVKAGDLALVNRSSNSYKLTGNKLTAGTFNDSDLFLINRAGASYQVAGSEIKTLLVPPTPDIVSASFQAQGDKIFGVTINLDGQLKAGQKYGISGTFVAPLNGSYPQSIGKKGTSGWSVAETSGGGGGPPERVVYIVNSDPGMYKSTRRYTASATNKIEFNIKWTEPINWTENGQQSLNSVYGNTTMSSKFQVVYYDEDTDGQIGITNIKSASDIPINSDRWN